MRRGATTYCRSERLRGRRQDRPWTRQCDFCDHLAVSAAARGRARRRRVQLFPSVVYGLNSRVLPVLPVHPPTEFGMLPLLGRVQFAENGDVSHEFEISYNVEKSSASIRKTTDLAQDVKFEI